LECRVKSTVRQRCQKSGGWKASSILGEVGKTATTGELWCNKTMSQKTAFAIRLALLTFLIRTIEKQSNLPPRRASKAVQATAMRTHGLTALGHIAQSKGIGQVDGTAAPIRPSPAIRWTNGSKAPPRSGW
jgi:hypothetical protein